MKESEMSTQRPDETTLHAWVDGELQPKVPQPLRNGWPIIPMKLRAWLPFRPRLQACKLCTRKCWMSQFRLSSPGHCVNRQHNGAGHMHWLLV